MKTIHSIIRLFITACLLLASNEGFSQLSIVRIIAYDGDNNGDIGTVEIEFNKSVNDTSFWNANVIEDWEFSVDDFTTSDHMGNFNTDVDSITTTSGGYNDQYIRYSVPVSNNLTGTGPVLFRYTNDGGDYAYALFVLTSSDTLQNIGISPTEDWGTPILDSAYTTSDTTIELQFTEKVVAFFSDPGDWTATGLTAVDAYTKSTDSTIIILKVNSIGSKGYTASDLTIVFDNNDSITDLAGNKPLAISGETIYDGLDPYFSYSSGVDNDGSGYKNLSVGDEITYVFSEPLHASSRTAISNDIEGAGEFGTPSSTTWDNDSTITFELESGFSIAYNGQYTLGQSLVYDPSNNYPTSDLILQMPAPLIDITPPTGQIDTVIWQNNSNPKDEYMANGDAFLIVFSEPMEADAVTIIDNEVEGDLGLNESDITVTTSDDSVFTVTFNRATPYQLWDNKRIRFEDPEISDANGNPITADISFWINDIDDVSPELVSSFFDWIDPDPNPDEVYFGLVFSEPVYWTNNFDDDTDVDIYYDNYNMNVSHSYLDYFDSPSEANDTVYLRVWDGEDSWKTPPVNGMRISIYIKENGYDQVRDLAENFQTLQDTVSASFIFDDSEAPDNQNTVFPNSLTVQGLSAVNITSSGDDNNEVWFALHDIHPDSARAWSDTMTYTAGNSTAIIAPKNEGVYHLYVIDLSGNVSDPSTARLVVDNTPPVIDSITINNAPMLVNDIVTAKIYVESDTTEYTDIDATVGEYTLESYSKVSDTLYTASFTITEGGTDVPAGNDIPVSLSITDPAGNVSSTFNTPLSQNADPIYSNYPTASLSGNNRICLEDSTTLTAQLTGYAPWSIDVDDLVATSFTLSGITSSPYYFKVSPSADGTYNYTITDVSDSSTLNQAGTGTATIIVDTLPVVTITNPPDLKTYSSSGTADTLTGTPANGVFSGPGVVPFNSTFHPSDAGNGTHSIVYTFTDGHSCTSTDTVDVVVRDSVAQIEIAAANEISCKEDPPFVITGTNDYVGVEGTFYIVIGGDKYSTGKGLENTGPNVATIYPDSISDGDYDIIYAHDPPSEFYVVENITIIDVSTPVINGVKDRCIDGDTIKLIATNLLPTDGDGYFSYNGPTNGLVIDLTDPDGNTVILKPDSMGVDSFDVAYYYHYATENCYSDTIHSTVNINPLPTVSFTAKELYNIEEGVDTLVGNYSPAGTFSGGAYITGDRFYPDVAGIGDKLITYSYTDGNGCSNSITDTVAVEESSGSIKGINSNRLYCYSAAADTFTADPGNSDGTPGYFSTFTGLSNIGSNMAAFNPAIAGGNPTGGTKVHPIAFQYTGWDSVTNFVLRDTITVDYIPAVDFNGLQSDYCENDEDGKLLTGDNPPMVGTGLFQPFSGLIVQGEDATLYPNLIASAPPHYITYEFESPTGCTRDTSKIFTLNPPPFVYFTIRETYNYEEPIIPLQGSPTGGIFYGDPIFSDSLFDPGYLDGPVSNVAITYEYTDGNNCTNDTTKYIDIVEKDADIEALRNTSKVYCIYEALDTIVGIPSINEPGGYFDVIPGLTNLGEDTALFDPAIAGGGIHIATYHYFDTYGTEFQVTAPLEVDIVEAPVFSNFAVNDEFCQNDKTKDILLSYQHEDYNVVFRLNGDAILGNIFNPADGQIGDNNLQCVYTKQSTGCNNSNTLTIIVNAAPDIGFSVSDNCVAELAPESITFINTTTLASLDSIIQWAWNFDDIYSGPANVDSIENPKHLYLESGSRQISLEAVTEKGCKSKETIRIDFGDKPVSDFYWTNECFTTNNLIAFYDNTSSNNPIQSRSWIFLDDSATSTLINPTHHYANLGNYNVKLIVTTDLGCKDTLTQTVYLRPTVVLLDSTYIENFESGEGGWHPSKSESTEQYSWVFGTPSGNTIVPPSSGTNVWYTIVNDISVPEQSWITSPCFDFSGIDRPMIKLNISRDMETNRNGAVIQSTIDNGQTWVNVGRQNEGINWYNSFEINQGPGGQSSGWTGLLSGWPEAKQHLEGLANKQNVRFRIAFSNDGNGLKDIDGFAFDNIWIGERSKNVLLEHFTNTSDNNSILATNNVNAIVNESNDIINIQYHTNFPGDDPFNQFYPAGPNARLLYYSIAGVPYSIVNGGYASNLKYNEQVTTLDKNDIIVWSLYDPLFEIDVQTSKSSGTFTIDADITALEDIDRKEISLRVAVIENEVEFPGDPSILFDNVLRCMLPSAGGTLIYQAWSINQEESYTFNWTIDGTVNQDNIYAVVFLQDETTGEVYQVATDDTSYITTDIVSPIAPLSGLHYIIYPNPTKDVAHILFNKAIAEDYQIQVIDRTGRVMTIHQLPENTQYYELSTSQYAAGMYFITITNKQGYSDTRKLIIIQN